MVGDVNLGRGQKRKAGALKKKRNVKRSGRRSASLKYIKNFGSANVERGRQR